MIILGLEKFDFLEEVERGSNFTLFKKELNGFDYISKRRSEDYVLVSYLKNDFGLEIRWTHSNRCFTVNILIDDVLVYVFQKGTYCVIEKKWVHTLPLKMLLYVEEEIRKIKVILDNETRKKEKEKKDIVLAERQKLYKKFDMRK